MLYLFINNRTYISYLFIDRHAVRHTQDAQLGRHVQIEHMISRVMPNLFRSSTSCCCCRRRRCCCIRAFPPPPPALDRVLPIFFLPRCLSKTKKSSAEWCGWSRRKRARRKHAREGANRSPIYDTSGELIGLAISGSRGILMSEGRPQDDS